MKCFRCDGTMNYEKFYGREESFWGWRCLYCGEILDSVVLKNRRSLKRSGK